MKTLKLSVNGEKQDVTKIKNETPGIVLKESILVSAVQRGGDAEKPSLEIAPDNLVELVFDDNTRWLCPSDTLEELYPGSVVQKRDGEAVLELPSELEHPDASRSLFGKIALKVLNLFVKEKGAGAIMGELAKDLEKKQLGSLRGLVRITKDFDLVKPDGIDASRPFVLFIHGTNSSTTGSFAELKGTSLWDYIVSSYGNNILALQHETLTKSPLENAVDLINQLPKNAILHIITHSRGGLVGEILCRFSNGVVMGFSEQEKSLLNKEDRSNDIKQIGLLQQLSPQKKFVVNKFVRVACPAGGTTIISKRLDHFFNISLNLLGLIPGFAVSPVYTAMKSLLVALVDQKNDINVLPGLEAMKPDSPFITVLNNQNNQSGSILLNNPVIAIAGNCKTKLNLKALVIIASKLFYLEENDLVVNTKSMYCGSKRLNKLEYFFDEGADVDHFSYFKNKKTNEAILLALKTVAGPVTGFSEFSRGTIGEAERNAALGLDGGEYSTGEPSGKKPVVILLPGIMGSSLANNNGLLWINYFKFLTGGLSNLSLDNNDISTSSIIKTSYKKLGDALADKYDVVTFAFDWRLSLKESAAKFNEKIIALLKLNQPIKIVGHSMGGVLVRDFMVFHSDTWEKLNATKDFKLLFLGSPLGGSFRINTVLFGEDDIINKLSKIDIAHSKKELIKMFATFPGILSLLPFNIDKENDFADIGIWKKMCDAFGDINWPVAGGENEALLSDFKEYRDAVLDAEKNKKIDYSNAVYIAGHDKQTPCGYSIEETIRGKELVFYCTGEGDQSVTWESGIPKPMIDAGTVYYVNYSHGALSNTPAIFNAVKEILEKGETSLISKNRPVIRGDKKVFRKPETTDFDLSPEGLANTLLSLPSSDESISISDLPIKVTVSHGDLKYASYPVLAGHFKNDGVLYAEARIDGLLNGILSQQHKLGLYPGEIGTHDIHLTYSNGGFPGAIIIGLDEPGSLTGFELAKSVELSIEKYLINIINKQNLNSGYQVKQPLGVTSLIIACGYGGLSVENSVDAILQGIINANTKISSLFKEKAKHIECVEFAELYEDTALRCMYAIRRLGKEAGGTLNITITNNTLNKIPGAKKQMLLDETNDWWNRITIAKQENKKGEITGMRFSISTSAAREDLRTVYTCTGIVDGLMKEISTDNNWTGEKARAIFELLIPNDFKSRLKKHGNIIWVLDEYTAGFPWELLQDKSQDATPLCINAGMIRQLVTTNSRLVIDSVPGSTALVVGDPDLKGFFPQLPGAYKEADEVSKLLTGQGYNARTLLNESAGTIVPALVSADYKIIHLAGHGVFNEDPDKPSGMVIGQNSFLTTAEIAQMSTTPELVFVNCCFLGKTNGVAESLFQERFKLAANIGTQLINNGVKAVIVAGWAVDDEAALTFAMKFYECMFQGKTFGEAVKAARENIYDNYRNKNTWGAYQTYGDPFYKLNERGGSSTEKNYIISEQAETDLNNLLSDLSTPDVNKEAIKNKLAQIIKEVEKQELRTPRITEMEAFIYKALNDYEAAIKKFEALLYSENASYSFTAAEQYCNIRIKHLITGIDSGLPTGPMQKEFDRAIADLQALIHLNPSAERYILLGSAFKRKIYFYKNNKAKAQQAVASAYKNYLLAFEASKEKNINAYINWASLKNILVLAGLETWDAKEPAAIIKLLKETKSSLPETVIIHNDYWDSIITSNIELCLWMLKASAEKSKMPDTKKVIESYRQVWDMIGSPDQKKIEVQHVNALIQAIEILKPDHFIFPDLTALRDGFNMMIEG